MTADHLDQPGPTYDRSAMAADRPGAPDKRAATADDRGGTADDLPPDPGSSLPVARAYPISARRLNLLDAAIATSIAAFVVYLVVAFAVRGWEGSTPAPSLDLVLDTVALVVLGASAALAWVRYRGRREPIAVYQAAAFLALAAADVTAVTVAVLGPTGAAAPDAATLAQRQLFVFTGARVVAGATLVIGGLQAQRGHDPRHAVAVALVPAGIALLVVAVAATGVAGSLSEVRGLPGSTFDLVVSPFGAFAQVAGAALAMAAAFLSRRLAHRRRSIGDAFVAFGLVLAACAQLAEALDPGEHPRDVAVGDVLWLGFAMVLLLGIEAEASATLRSLRMANRRLEELRDVAAERAALEERARLSRELHDGLAQDLWYAKLKATRLAAFRELPADATDLVAELAGAIDASLADSRNAVLALRSEATAGSSLRQLLEQSADDFEDRFGVRTERSIQDEPPWLGVRAQAELLQIARQALRNTGQHADATLVRIETASSDSMFRLTIQDNGHGFEPRIDGAGRFGLAGMRERAALIGGDVEIESRRWGGTRVSVTLPTPGEGGETAP